MMLRNHYNPENGAMGIDAFPSQCNLACLKMKFPSYVDASIPRFFPSTFLSEAIAENDKSLATPGLPLAS